MSFSMWSSPCQIVYLYTALWTLTNNSHILMLVRGLDFKNWCPLKEWENGGLGGTALSS